MRTGDSRGSLQTSPSYECGKQCLSCKSSGHVEGAGKSQSHHRCKKLSVPEEHSDNESDDKPQLMGEAKAAMQDVQDMNDSSDDDITLDERVQMLNVDQKRIYEKVKMHLLHLLSHESGECSCDFKIFKMYVSGVGGTGKFFLIHALKSLIHQIWPSSDLSCAMAAPTGLAAVNVRGMTIHRLFQLPIEREVAVQGLSESYEKHPLIS